MDISKRLKSIASYTNPYRYVIDVGTDHCLVPIYLALNGLIDQAIATDLNSGPINEAKKNVANYDLTKKIDVRLGHGLSTITDNDSCDVIIVAGMGGKLITDILNSGKKLLHLNKRLVLQPNVGEEILRKWLCENYYEIVDEILIKEEEIIYEIIVSNRINYKINYTKEELKFGPILLKQKNALFIEKWQALLQHNISTFIKIPLDHENKTIFQNEIKLIKKIIENG